MPAALDVDHEQVKAVAVQIGVREAARQFGLLESTVKSWSKREAWFKQIADTTAIVEKSIAERGLRPVAAISPSEILRKLGDKSKLRAARLGDNTLKAISRKRDDALIAVAPAFKQTVDALSKVHAWDAPSQNLTQVNINLTGQRFEKAP
jgi:hypothetical protein